MLIKMILIIEVLLISISCTQSETFSLPEARREVASNTEDALKACFKSKRIQSDQYHFSFNQSKMVCVNSIASRMILKVNKEKINNVKLSSLKLLMSNGSIVTLNELVSFKPNLDSLQRLERGEADEVSFLFEESYHVKMIAINFKDSNYQAVEVNINFYQDKGYEKRWSDLKNKMEMVNSKIIKLKNKELSLKFVSNLPTQTSDSHYDEYMYLDELEDYLISWAQYFKASNSIN